MMMMMTKEDKSLSSTDATSLSFTVVLSKLLAHNSSVCHPGWLVDDGDEVADECLSSDFIMWWLCRLLELLSNVFIIEARYHPPPTHIRFLAKLLLPLLNENFLH